MLVGPIVTHAIELNGMFWTINALALSGIVLTLLVVHSDLSHTLNCESGIVCGSIGKVLANPQLLKLNMAIFACTPY